MPIHKKLPLNFWDQNDVTSLNVLAEVLSEIRRPIDVIEAFSKILLERDLSEEMQVDVQAIYDSNVYLRSVMDAALEYVNKQVDS